MKCGECQQKIKPFIEKKLSDREMEAYLRHIRECPECFDEAETYYAVHMGIRYMESGTAGTLNIPKMFAREIAERERRLRRLLCIRICCAAAGVLALAGFGVLFLQGIIII